MVDAKQLGEEIVKAVREFVERHVRPLARRLDELAQRLDGIPTPRDGRDGVDGQDGAPGHDGAAGAKGDRGAPGERGERGEKGEPGAPGAPGAKGDRGDPGDPGERGERGERGEKGEPGVPGAPGDRGEKGETGDDGEPGRDALEIDIHPAITQGRRYARGTFASHKGGLWRSSRTTDGMDGWDCIVDGLANVSVAMEGRTCIITVARSSGALVSNSFSVPVMAYRGVFKESEFYHPGDTVTWAGSLWHCNADTAERPGEGSDAWTLCAKKGRDGRDGNRGEKGERGAEGRAGRDLTQMTHEGARF